MARWLAGAVAALALASGCGDDGSGAYVEDPATESAPLSNAACRKVSRHPVRVSTEPLRSVLACSTRDARSLYLENRSSQVLRIRPDERYDRISMAFVDEERDRKSPAIDAVYSTTGGGLDVRKETFVVPLGASMTAKSRSNVAAEIVADFDLTVAGNVARYFAAWSASERSARGEKLVRPIRRCAASMRNTVDEGAYVEDALRQALETAQCRRVIDEVALEDGTDPAALRPRARAQILRRARAVLRDRLLPRRTTVVARG